MKRKNTQNQTGFVVPKPMNNKLVMKLRNIIASRGGMVVLGVLIFAALVGGAVVYMLSGMSQDTRDTAQVVSSGTRKLIAEAELLDGSGQVDKAIDLIDAQYKKSARSDLDRATLRSTQAQYALNDGKYDEAVRFAQTANKQYELATSHALIGYAAEQKQDWRLAADSFARAVQLSDPTDPGEASPANDYKNLEAAMRKRL